MRNTLLVERWVKHAGPGPHPSGSSQEAHGGGDKATSVHAERDAIQDAHAPPEWAKDDFTDSSAYYDRVVWGVTSGQTIPTNSLGVLGVTENDLTHWWGLHITSDSDYWVHRLSEDYGRDVKEAQVIRVKPAPGDFVLDDPQYMTDPDTGDKADSAVLVTQRRQLVHGVDWIFEDEEWKEEAHVSKGFPEFDPSQPRDPSGQWASVASGPWSQTKDAFAGEYPEQSPGEDDVTWYDTRVTPFREKERAWDLAARQAVSLGVLSQEDALARGLTSPQMFTNQWGESLTDKWQVLPEVLYHATTSKDAVLADRLKSRKELQQGLGHGLGGGDDETISFTSDREVAHQIARAVKEARQAARGDLTIVEMVAQAERGHEATRPWLNDLIRSGTAFIGGEKEWKPGDPLPERWRMALEGKEIVSNGFGDPVPPGHEPFGEGWLGGDGVRRYNYVLRPMSPERLAEARVEVFKTWSFWRQFVSTKMDPLFFLSNPQALTDTPEDQIAVLRVRPTAKHRGIQASGLSEWRTFTGHGLHVELDEPLTTKGLKHYGPGAHPGTGTAQEVHGPGDGTAPAGGNDPAWVSSIQRGIQRAIEERPGRSTHGHTATNAFFLVNGRVIPWNEVKTGTWTAQESWVAVAVHSHAGELPAPGIVDREPLMIDTFSGGDIESFIKGYKRGLKEELPFARTWAVIGRRVPELHTLQITEATKTRELFKLTMKQIEAEVGGPYQTRLDYHAAHPEYGALSDVYFHKEKMRAFAEKYGLGYRDDLRWRIEEGAVKHYGPGAHPGVTKGYPEYNPQQPRDHRGQWGSGAVTVEATPKQPGWNADGTVTLLHGTSASNAAKIRAEGFKPFDPQGIAQWAERQYGLPENAVLNHPAFQFNSQTRAGDPSIYLTGFLETAQSYTVPESFQDALTATFMIQHPEWGQGDANADRGAMQAWVRAETQRWTQPEVVAVTIPWQTLAESFPAYAPDKWPTMESLRDVLDGELPNTVVIPAAKLRGARIAPLTTKGLKHAGPGPHPGTGSSQDAHGHGAPDGTVTVIELDEPLKEWIDRTVIAKAGFVSHEHAQRVGQRVAETIQANLDKDLIWDEIQLGLKRQSAFRKEAMEAFEKQWPDLGASRHWPEEKLKAYEEAMEIYSAEMKQSYEKTYALATRAGAHWVNEQQRVLESIRSFGWPNGQDSWSPSHSVMIFGFKPRDGMPRAHDSEQFYQERTKLKDSMRTDLGEALNYLPTTWIEQIQSQPLGIRSVSEEFLKEYPGGPTRGHYNPRDAAIVLSQEKWQSREIVPTVVHELGHHIEHTIPEVRGLTREFFAARTKGDTPKPLGHGYQPNEMSLRDKWFTDYVGRSNSLPHTEVVSMGLQTFLAEGTSSTFYRENDPGTYHFILGLLAAGGHAPR